MKEENWLIFSTDSPNDQGGIIPNSCIDFSRFEKNPVILKQHLWDSEPLGIAAEWKYNGSEWLVRPEFHRITEDSKTYADLYEGKFLRSSSIGGKCIWKTTGGYTYDENNKKIPEFYRNEAGYRVAERFILYEISLVTLPSNPDAVQLGSVRFYEDDEIENVETSIITLNSNLKKQTMAKDPKEVETDKTEETTEKAAPEVKKVETEEKDLSKHVILSSEGTPGFLTELGNFISSMKTAFSSKETVKEETPIPLHKEPGGGDPIESKIVPDTDVEKKVDSEPTGLEVKKKKMDDAKKKMDEAKEEDKEKYTTEYESSKKEYEAEAECSKNKTPAPDKDAPIIAEITKQKSIMDEQTTLKSEKEVVDEGVKLAPKPEVTARFKASDVTFTKLRTALESGDKSTENIFGRVFDKNSAIRDISDYQILLQSMLNDPELNRATAGNPSVLSMIRLHQNVLPQQLSQYRHSNAPVNGGMNIQQLAAKVLNGQTEYADFSDGGRMKAMTTQLAADGTDYALANPQLTGIAFLSMFIMKLFPSNAWESECPVFGVEETTKNQGLIWTNVNADPTIYRGAKPTITTAYTYDDLAVSVSLTKYWLEAMAWTPMDLHLLRTDKMATGWAQAFNKLYSVISTDLLYTLLSTVPAASIVKTKGSPFTIATTDDVDAFKLAPAFTGSLAKPTLNDIIRLEQIYNKQNFATDTDNPVVVFDPTALSYLSQDDKAQSKLTEWKRNSAGDIVGFKNTKFYQRSEVGIYDPASGLMKDPNGVIPATSVSACASFIPSQVAIAQGILDVFMVQSPKTFSYEMSANLRRGIAPLRSNKNGTAALTYGEPTN